MKQLRIIAIVVSLVLMTTGLYGQNAGVAPNQGAGKAGTPTGNILKITSPRSGEQLHQNFVDVQFELTNGGASASGIPTFQVKLDSRDPINTDSTSYTFDGLKPGPHTVAVQLVDANGTPVAGASSQVPFVVVQQGAAPAAGTAPTARAAIALRHRTPAAIRAALRVEEPAPQQFRTGNEQLPSAAGALPLLSVIGFGVLLGGIASAMKTRPK